MNCQMACNPLKTERLEAGPRRENPTNPLLPGHNSCHNIRSQPEHLHLPTHESPHELSTRLGTWSYELASCVTVVSLPRTASPTREASNYDLSTTVATSEDCPTRPCLFCHQDEAEESHGARTAVLRLIPMPECYWNGPRPVAWVRLRCQWRKRVIQDSSGLSSHFLFLVLRHRASNCGSYHSADRTARSTATCMSSTA
jgi:hypothetical protein